jgi:cytochrome c553
MRFLAAWLGLAGVGADAAEEAAADGTSYRSRCARCHGQNGWGDEEKRVPAIAGLPAAYVAAQWTAYREERREEARMHAEAVRDTAPDEVAATAGFIAGLEPLRPVREGQPADVAQGRKVLRELCAECHGEKAEGRAERGAPPLTGFQGWYVVDQIRRFRDFARTGDADSLDSSRMHAIAYKVIGVEDAEDVAAYLAETASAPGGGPARPVPIR